MSVCFVLEPRAFEHAEARWALSQLAPLLDAPWRVAPEGAEIGEQEVVAFVGDPSRAPAGAAAAIAFGDWPRWEPAALALAAFDRAPLPCPGGSCPPPASPRELPAPWLRAVFFLLSREEELLDRRRDVWGCYSGFSTRLHELGVLGRPLVNLYAAQLRARLDAGAAGGGRALPRVPRWKDGAPFAAALTHDVDDVRLHSVRQALRLLRQGRSPRDHAVREGLRGIARRGADPYARFERWADEESRRGFRSTFFAFAPRPSRRHAFDAAYRWSDRVPFDGRRVTVAGMLRELDGRGFEVGLHGSYLSHRSAGELRTQKGQIEAELGHAIESVRQHFLRFNREATWEAQEAAGFACDGTLGYNETPGFRAGIAAPFEPWSFTRRAPHRLVELPLTCMDGALFRSLALDPAAAAQATLDHLSEVEGAGGLAGLLWHPNAAAEELFPGWWSCYVAALDRLEQRGAWAAPAGEIARWWRERSGRLRL